MLAAALTTAGCALLGSFGAPPGHEGEDPAWLLTGERIGASPAPWLDYCRRDPDRARCFEPSTDVPLSEERWAELEAVQASVNGGYIQRPDSGVGDHWTVMDQELAGDCEDFALTKRDRLIRAGWPAGALHIGVCFNHDQPVDGADMHAVLLVDTDRGSFVLGNLLDGVRPWFASECRDWVMRSAAPDWRWARHGPRVPLRRVGRSP